jgi:hypothetical protein
LADCLEYARIPKYKTKKHGKSGTYQWSEGLIDSIVSPENWKVGSIEPTTGLHGDIEYLYTIEFKGGDVKLSYKKM